MSSRNLKEYKRPHLSSRDFSIYVTQSISRFSHDFLRFFEMTDLEFLISWEMNNSQFSKLWDKKSQKISITSAHPMNSRHIWHFFHSVQDGMYFGNILWNFSHFIVQIHRCEFKNELTLLVKALLLVVERSSRSVNFSNELRKAFQ